MRRIIKLLVVVLIFLGVLRLGGYTWYSFTRSIEAKNPEYVWEQLKSWKPDVNVDLDFTLPSYTVDPTDPLAHPSGNGHNGTPGSYDPNDPFGFDLPWSKIEISYGKKISVTINGNTIELESVTSISFIKWLSQNYSETNPEAIQIETETESSTDLTLTTDTDVPSESSEVSESTEPKSTINPALIDEAELSWDDTLLDEAHLRALMNDIEIVDELPDYDTMVANGEWDKYNRDLWEKPVHSYNIGTKFNRNDYSWVTSPWIDSENWTYTCPYTGIVITDVYGSDTKEDHDFGVLDYDHIVPLKSAYIRGGYAWTDEAKNTYAYDQWVGIDVLNSANRSKSDKGPVDYLPDINIEDYCYSWLLICSKYDLVMTQAEMDICYQYIEEALCNGEPVTHLGGHYEES